MTIRGLSFYGYRKVSRKRVGSGATARATGMFAELPRDSAVCYHSRCRFIRRCVGEGNEVKVSQKPGCPGLLVRFVSEFQAPGYEHQQKNFETVVPLKHVRPVRTDPISGRRTLHITLRAASAGRPEQSRLLSRHGQKKQLHHHHQQQQVL